MVRLLHTSDWHLGAAIKRVECREEQQRFLSWLVETLDDRAIDVLVVAGDVFDYAGPSNAAQKLYFGFLARCAQLDGLRKVVVVAGNHDSPSGLEAPGELLDQLDVHVVGALPRDDQRWGECLAPVENDAGVVDTVVAAVPYIQEARLGVRLNGGDESDLRQNYQEAFTRVYKQLADQASTRWPDAALVATGHLTVYGEENQPEHGDFHSTIHRAAHPERRPDDQAIDEFRRIGTIDPMGPRIFDDRFSYVALGHIHRPMPVGGGRRIRYCGTPVATSLAEGNPNAPRRQVIEVDLDQTVDKLDIDPIPVPRWRDIFELVDTEDGVCQRLADLQSDAELPPAVFVRVELGVEDVPGADRLSTFKRLIEDNYPAGARPIIAELREQLGQELVADGGMSREELPPIDDLDYVDVFTAMYRRQNPEREQPPERLIERFRTLEQCLNDRDSSDDADRPAT